jgi:hypothetical protein
MPGPSLKLLTISAQLRSVLINSLFFILFTKIKKIITRHNYIGNNISYFLNNLPYRVNGYEMIFTHILIHLLNKIKFLPLLISNKLTEKQIYSCSSYRIRYESDKWIKGYTPLALLCVILSYGPGAAPHPLLLGSVQPSPNWIRQAHKTQQIHM